MLLTEQEIRAREMRSIMLFRALTNPSVAGYPSGTEVSALLPSLSFFESLNPRDVLRLYTPFVASNSRRLASALEEQSSPMSMAVSNFALAAFDAFLPLLPEQFTLTVHYPGALALPTLGIRFGDDSESVKSITLASRSSIAIASDSRTVELSLEDIPPEFKLNFIPLRRLPSVRAIAAAPSSLLFEREYIDQLSEEHDSMSRVGSLADEALELISAAGAAHFSRIQNVMRYIVPIQFTDAHVHRSFTSPLLCGVVFASPNSSPVGMAEAIVHEIAHSELNMLMEVDSLFVDSPQPLYYSPWRPDPRPIAGLFHALYVFSRVLQFLDDLGTVVPSFRSAALDRGRLIAHRLNIGLAQIHDSCLHARAKELKNDVTIIAKTFLGKHCPLEPKPPKELSEHLFAWLDRNPSLASSVVLSTNV